MDKRMTREQFEGFAKGAIVRFADVFERENEEGPTDIMESDIVLVWFNCTLGNMKALYEVSGSDLYFECTYNKERSEVYIDEYGKIGNMQISLNSETEPVDSIEY